MPFKYKCAIKKNDHTRPTYCNVELEEVGCVQVLADVTQSVDLLAKAIAGSDAVIVATGFRPSFDITASWKVISSL